MTPARPYKKENRLVDTRMQMAGATAMLADNPAPSVKTESEDGQEMAEDIGLLQSTIIRAPFSKLPKPTSWEFYSYFWTLLKARFSALYTRSLFKRCVHKNGIASWLPVDFMKQKALKNQAKRMYKRYYELLAACVSPPTVPSPHTALILTPSQRRRQIPPKALPPAPRRLTALSNRRSRPRKNVLDPPQIQVRTRRLAPQLPAGRRQARHSIQAVHRASRVGAAAVHDAHRLGPRDRQNAGAEVDALARPEEDGCCKHYDGDCRGEDAGLG